MPHKDSEIYRAMFTAISTTLENMAFIEVAEQPAEALMPLPEDAAWVSILIHDPLQGEVRLAMPRNLLASLTADMFGLEPDEIQDSQQKDIIAEVLNTLAGVFMTNLLPDDQTYQLGLPEHGEGPLPEIEEGSIVWNLQVEENPLMLVASGVGLISAK